MSLERIAHLIVRCYFWQYQKIRKSPAEFVDAKALMHDKFNDGANAKLVETETLVCMHAFGLGCLWHLCAFGLGYIPLELDCLWHLYAFGFDCLSLYRPMHAKLRPIPPWKWAAFTHAARSKSEIVWDWVWVPVPWPRISVAPECIRHLPSGKQLHKCFCYKISTIRLQTVRMRKTTWVEWFPKRTHHAILNTVSIPFDNDHRLTCGLRLLLAVGLPIWTLPEVNLG